MVKLFTFPLHFSATSISNVQTRIETLAEERNLIPVSLCYIPSSPGNGAIMVCYIGDESMQSESESESESEFAPEPAIIESEIPVNAKSAGEDSETVED